MSDRKDGITWGPTIEARLRDERAKRSRTAGFLSRLQNQTGLYAEEHRRYIALTDEIIGVILKHNAAMRDEVLSKLAAPSTKGEG